MLFSARLPEPETARLRLLPADPALAQRTADFYVRNRAFLTPFEPLRGEQFFTVEGQRRDLRWNMQEAAEGHSVRFFIERKDAPGPLIGCVAINGIILGNVCAGSLGYKMDEHEQGRGYMTEAVMAVTEYAFRDLGLHRLMAEIMPRNLSSRRMIEKCGYQEEGYAKEYLNINGAWEDHVLYAKVNSRG